MSDDDDPLTCCLCGGAVEDDRGWRGGHNPAPLAREGRCCGRCNRERVLPARFLNLFILTDDGPKPA